MTEEPVFELIETFCCQTRRQVIIDLTYNQKARGDMVKGKPESCNYGTECCKGKHCVLNFASVETTRRKR
jgi:hypothetical protein